MITRTYNVIDYVELNELMVEHFNLSSFECALESSNDASYTAHDLKKGSLQDYEKDDLEDMLKKEGCEYYNFSTLIVALIDKDVLPEGDYLMQVSW